VPAGIEAKAGVKLTVSNLDTKKLCDVTGDTKGRGFAGVNAAVLLRAIN
jgi:ribosomal protein L3